MYYMESMDVFSYIIHMLMSVRMKENLSVLVGSFSYGNNLVKRSSFILLEYRDEEVVFFKGKLRIHVYNTNT